MPCTHPGFSKSRHGYGQEGACPKFIVCLLQTLVTPAEGNPRPFATHFPSPDLNSAALRVSSSSDDALVAPVVSAMTSPAGLFLSSSYSGSGQPALSLSFWNMALSWRTCGLSVRFGPVSCGMMSPLLSDPKLVSWAPSLLSAPSLGGLSQRHGFTSGHPPPPAPPFASQALASSMSSRSPGGCPAWRSRRCLRKVQNETLDSTAGVHLPSLSRLQPRGTPAAQALSLAVHMLLLAGSNVYLHYVLALPTFSFPAVSP